MKTLKKTLVLMLTMALCFGLVGTAFAVDNFEPFADAEKVGDAYIEAIDVMVGVGIINGMNANTLAPEGNYTREQAAKIVTYMKLGKTAAENLRVDKSDFKDVEANRWSAPYIAYCENAGIIDGMGDGTFQPEAKVTGLQFAKMLLCAVGYGANDEYVGESWGVETAKDALAKGIFEGDLSASTHDPIQRQQAVLMAFNTLVDVNTVKWSKLVDDYILTRSGEMGKEVDPNLLSMNFKLLCTTSNRATDSEPDALEYYSRTGEFKIDGIVVDETVANVGKVGRVWFVVTPKGEMLAVSDVYYNNMSTLLGESTDGTSYKDLTDKNNDKFIAAAEDHPMIFENGFRRQVMPALGRGDLVQFWNTDNDSKADVILCFTKKADIVGEKGVEYNTKETKARIDDIVSRYTDVEKLDGFEGLAKDDVVQNYIDCTNVHHFEKLDAVKADLTEIQIIKSDHVYTVSGEEHMLAHNCIKEEKLVDALNDNVGKEVNFYFDEYGYIVYAVPVEKSISDFVVITEIGTVEKAGSKLSSKHSMYASFVNVSDGSIENVPVKSITLGVNEDTDKYEFADGGTVGSIKYTDKSPQLGNGESFVNQFYTYTKDSHGKYEFTVVGGMKVNKTDKLEQENNVTLERGSDEKTIFIKKGDPALWLNETYKTGNSTVYVFPDDSGYKSVTGYKNVPTIGYMEKGTENPGRIAYIKNIKTGMVEYVFVDGLESNNANADDAIFIIPGTKSIVKDGTKWLAVVDGEIKPVVIDKDVEAKEGPVVPSYDEGKITGISDVKNVRGMVRGLVVDDGTLTIGYEEDFVTWYAFDKEKVKCVSIGKDDSGLILGDSIETDVNDMVWVVDDNDGNLKHVYQVEVEDPSEENLELRMTYNEEGSYLYVKGDPAVLSTATEYTWICEDEVTAETNVNKCKISAPEKKYSVVITFEPSAGEPVYVTLY